MGFNQCLSYVCFVENVFWTENAAMLEESGRGWLLIGN